MKITHYQYKQVAVEDVEIFIPQKPFYCFQTGVRRSIRIIPITITWDDPNRNKGDLISLEVTCVYQSFEIKVEKFNLNLNMMEHYLHTGEKGNHAEIAMMLLKDDYSKRTKKQFDTDLSSVITLINS